MNLLQARVRAGQQRGSGGTVAEVPRRRHRAEGAAPKATMQAVGGAVPATRRARCAMLGAWQPPLAGLSHN